MSQGNIFVATVATYVKKGGVLSSDVNGKNAVILNVISGQCPKKRVITGTIAENMGIAPGNTYVFSWTKEEDDPTFGVQYSFNLIGKPSLIELMEIANNTNPPKLFEEVSKVLVNDKGMKVPE